MTCIDSGLSSLVVKSATAVVACVTLTVHLVTGQARDAYSSNDDLF